MVMGEVVFLVFGEDCLLFYIYMDYFYGQLNCDVVCKYFIEQGLWEDVGGVVIVEGEIDYSFQIQVFEDFGVDMLYFFSFGNFVVSGFV